MNGINAFMKKTPEIGLVPLLCEDVVRCQMSMNH